MLRIAFVCILSLTSCLVAQADLPALIPMRVGNLFGYCDATLQLVIPPQFEDAQPFGQYGAVVKKNAHFGIIDAQGQWKVPAILDEVIVGNVLQLRIGAYFALADVTGCVQSDYCFDKIHELKSGFLLTERAGKEGLLAADGMEIVPNRYDNISQMRDIQGNYVDLFSTRANELQGVYNHCGQLVQVPRFSRIDIFQEGFAVVQENGRFGLLDVEGQLRVPCQYDLLQPMSEGLCAAKIKNRWGFIDAQGREALPFIFESVHETGFYLGRAAVNKAGTWVFVNRASEVEFPLDNGYQSLGILSEGLAAVCKLIDEGDVRYGYADTDGHLRIGLRYDRADPFSKGFAVVGMRVAKDQSIVKEMRFGVIDHSGRSIISMVLRSQTEARLKRDSLGHLGFTTLIDHGRNCKVDSHGQRFDCQSNSIDALQRAWMSTRCEAGDRIAVARDGLWGFCERRGRLVIPCQYANVQCFESGLAKVWPVTAKGDIFYYIDASGRAYYEPAE